MPRVRPSAAKSAPWAQAHHLVQHRVPKLDAVDLTPARWPSDPPLEWSAAGDGALYAALYDSGTIDSLTARGFRYACVCS